ncbi:hypothetical protein [Streptomyces sp. NPDC090021]|uniref:hypothetical protein n=1 Tax=Streptomyces sp. NPDC090021 TaxID=3365919 RepID=UPI003827A149
MCFPDEYKEISACYGDALIDGFLYVYGPLKIAEKSEWMSDYVARGESRKIKHPVLPSEGGMLHWGHTIEGDKLFLTPRGGGEWAVSAFRRNWGDWYETDLRVDEWLLGVFSGNIETDWLPEWPQVHTFEVSSP